MIKTILKGIMANQVDKAMNSSTNRGGQYLYDLGFKENSKTNKQNISFYLEDIKQFKENYKISNQVAEVVCNCYYANIAVGGKLFLTSEGIEFHPHRVMQDFSMIKFSFAEIQIAKPSKQFYILNTCMTIVLKDETQLRFVIGEKRMDWIKIINGPLDK